ncbi:Rhodanese-like domain-containing protein [Lasiosphaeris hirsuta]|uniref:Rhodanese-like domain-containing protein n=1 Tax=Lasiosphaeris hirsuta TaxID=260670 RepID=A0AA40AEZ5_9PEZI|nr:Rhodanese-like domain-containing protein [Lasiosphaeris hirsuta]
MASRRSIASLARTATPLKAPGARTTQIQQPQRRQLHLQQNRYAILASSNATANRQQPQAPAASRSTITPAQTRSFLTTKKGSAPEPPPSKIYDFEAMKALIESPSHKVTIVDTREPRELQETGWIPGAINIPITTRPDAFYLTEGEFEDHFGFPRPARDAQVVFYCKAGVRSRGAASLAKEASWTNVGEYPGSWLDWAAKGGKVQR